MLFVAERANMYESSHETWEETRGLTWGTFSSRIDNAQLHHRPYLHTHFPSHSHHRPLTISHVVTPSLKVLLLLQRGILFQFFPIRREPATQVQYTPFHSQSFLQTPEFFLSLLNNYAFLPFGSSRYCRLPYDGLI